MKKSIFLLLFLIPILSYSQTDVTPETKTIYCELVGTGWLGKVTVEVDMGESKGFLGLNTSYLIDPNTNKAIKFNSMVDAMNYMGEKGWSFEQAYAVSSGSTNVYRWLLSTVIFKGTDGNYTPATKKAFGGN